VFVSDVFPATRIFISFAVFSVEATTFSDADETAAEVAFDAELIAFVFAFDDVLTAASLVCAAELTTLSFEDATAFTEVDATSLFAFIMEDATLDLADDMGPPPLTGAPFGLGADARSRESGMDVVSSEADRWRFQSNAA